MLASYDMFWMSSYDMSWMSMLCLRGWEWCVNGACCMGIEEEVEGFVGSVYDGTRRNG